MRARTRRITALAVLGLALAAGHTTPQARTYMMLAPFPQGDLLVAQPEIQWPIWSEDGIRIENTELTLDGRPLPSRYEPSRPGVVSRLTRPLAPGKYRAVARVKLDGVKTVSKEWTFRVLPGALPSLPAPTLEQELGIKVVNDLRREHGLPPMTSSRALHAASSRHAQYMAANNQVGHLQKPGARDFFAVGHGQRAQMFGYALPSAELTARTSDGVAQAVRDLFHAPYHRYLFLRPGQLEAGAGFSGQYSCLQFGGLGESGIVVSPPDRAQDVPAAWDGVERPDPLARPGLNAPVGYVPMLVYYGGAGDKLQLISASLKDERGREVQASVAHPGNDRNSENCVLIIPARPLEPGTTYTASVSVAVTGGREFRRTWSFRTARG